MELWTHVTMSYRRHDDGSLEPPPVRNVDTGMGLERLLMVVQGQASVFGCDHIPAQRAHLARLFGALNRSASSSVLTVGV